MILFMIAAAVVAAVLFALGRRAYWRRAGMKFMRSEIAELPIGEITLQGIGAGQARRQLLDPNFVPVEAKTTRPPTPREVENASVRYVKELRQGKRRPRLFDTQAELVSATYDYL